jgi:hypothetical protein
MFINGTRTLAENIPTNGNDAMFAIEIATWLVTRFIRYARLTEHSEDCSLTIQISSGQYLSSAMRE